MKLEQIGFYTLSDDRAVNASPTSPLWRCELILTDKCNFMCPYCRGLRSDVSGEMDFSFAMSIVREWCDQGLRNVRFSGGEPMLYSGLASLVHYCKSRGVERIAISTNGSASKEMYTEMIDAGVTDFSVSLDACCSAVADRMSGYSGAWDTVVENIKWLAERQYTTVGIVVNRENIATCLGTILLADSLGVSDIRVISAAQYDQLLTNLAELPDKVLKKYPILDYRVSNIRSGRHVRGLRPGDSDRCWLALDDMAVAGRYHFPCIICGSKETRSERSGRAQEGKENYGLKTIIAGLIQSV